MFNKAEITNQEMTKLPLDCGSLTRVLKEKGLKAKGCFDPVLEGMITIEYDVKRRTTVYTQKI